MSLIFACFDIVGPYGVVCDTIRRDSISLLGFPFFVHVYVFSCEISLVCRLKCPNSCFSFHFGFLLIFVLLVFVLPVSFLVAVIRLPRAFLCSLRVVVSMDQRYLQRRQVLFLLFFCQCHLWVLCIIISFLVLWSLCLGSSQVYFKNGQEYPTRGQPRYLSLLSDSCYIVWCRIDFLLSWDSLSQFFSFISICLMMSAFSILKYMYVSFSQAFLFFLICLFHFFRRVLFPALHYKHIAFFNAKFHPNILFLLGF